MPEGFTWQFDPAFHQKIITSDDQSTIKKTIHQVGFWYGEHSPFAQKEDLDQVRSLGMSMTMIPNAYHAVMLDAPDILQERIIELCQKTIDKPL